MNNDYEERVHRVLDDFTLMDFWKESGKSISDFVNENKALIDEVASLNYSGVDFYLEHGVVIPLISNLFGRNYPFSKPMLWYSENDVVSL